MRRPYRKWFALALVASIVLLIAFGTVLSESYSASTMRLLHYEGDVQIEDASGQSRFVMENVRFSSGEAMRTGEGSNASVSLDPGKILTLDEKSRVEFSQQSNAMVLTLTDGSLFLDVQEKLGADETLDIQTSTMVVGIRGTIVFVTVMPAADYAARTGADLEEVLAVDASGSGMVSMLGVLEGTAQLSYQDEAGASLAMPVEAGQKATLLDSNENGLADAVPQVAELGINDINAFLSTQLEDPEIYRRAGDALDFYTSDGDWTWDGTVTLVAQSASKLYDGEPLTRPGDVLVYGLPDLFTIRVSAGGSQTDAGESANPISRYTIYNRAGEDVTRHFPNIETVSGRLVVDPAPITIWTGSAEKVYDGTPLTEPQTAVRAHSGFEANQPVWRNTSYVATESSRGSMSYGFTSETLYGVSGVIWVHGTNPLTGETREIELRAGQRMTVYLSDRDGTQSIEFRIEEMSETDVPQEILRLYAQNPELLAMACADTGWDMELMLTLIDDLPAGGSAVIESDSLYVEEGERQKLMIDATNVRINIDTDITDYNGRALGEEEAHYTPVSIDKAIIVTATGSQTDVGQSANTYTLDWGSARPGNYVLSEELGTLTVTAAPLTVTTGSASKIYDGSPLTCDEAEITGLIEGESATVTATGSITEPGSEENTYSISWGSAKATNYAINEELGTLRVTRIDDPVTLTAASDSKPYDGTALTNGDVTASGLPSGYSFTAKASGSQTDAGESSNTVSSYAFYNASGKDVTSAFHNVTTVSGTLTVTPLEATVVTGSASAVYDGTALKNSEAYIEGLAETDSVTITATGSQTNAGSSENGYSIDWGSSRESNYTLSEDLGTLTVEPLQLSVVLDDETVEYTGSTVPLWAGPKVTYTNGNWAGGTVELGRFGTSDYHGFLNTEDELRLTVTGSGTNAGTYPISASCEVSGSAASNYDISVTDGTLTIEPAPATVKTGSAEKVFDGKPLTSEEASIEGLVGSDAVTVTCSGTITNKGSTDNTYTIDWGSVDPDNYTLSEDLGTLTVEALELRVSADDITSDYTGMPVLPPTALTYVNGDDASSDVSPDQVTLSSLSYTLSTGDQVVLYIEGNGPDAGTTDLSASAEFLSGDASNYEITYDTGKATIRPLNLTVTTGSASKEYDGTELTNSEASVETLIPGETVTITATGSITDPGSEKNSYDIQWDGAKESNYTLTEELGTLEVQKNSTSIVFTASSASKDYDGSALTSAGVTAEGVPSGFSWTASASGSQTEVGTGVNTVSEYHILDGNERDVTEFFSDISTVDGTLEVNSATLNVTFDLHCTEPVNMDGYPHYPPMITGTYEDGSKVDGSYEEIYEYEGAFATGMKGTFHMKGGATIVLECESYTAVGNHTIEPKVTITEGSISYNISYVNNVLKIQEKVYGPTEPPTTDPPTTDDPPSGYPQG